MGAGAWISKSLSGASDGTDPEPEGSRVGLGRIEDMDSGRQRSTLPAHSTRAAVPPHPHPNLLQCQHLRRSRIPLVSGSVGLQFTAAHASTPSTGSMEEGTEIPR